MRGRGGGRGGGGGGKEGGGKRIRGDAVFSFVGADKAHKGNCGLEGREGEVQTKKQSSINPQMASTQIDGRESSFFRRSLE